MCSEKRLLAGASALTENVKTAFANHRVHDQNGNFTQVQLRV